MKKLKQSLEHPNLKRSIPALRIGVKFLTFYEVKGMGMEHARQQTYRVWPMNPPIFQEQRLRL